LSPKQPCRQQDALLKQQDALKTSLNFRFSSYPIALEATQNVLQLEQRITSRIYISYNHQSYLREGTHGI
uniref:TLE_N domain-containing protein n=1 Tax=Haemonchus placei TaxID=6290 RepID=A0A0N4W604_HAEPC